MLVPFHYGISCCLANAVEGLVLEPLLEGASITEPDAEFLGAAVQSANGHAREVQQYQRDTLGQ